MPTTKKERTDQYWLFKTDPESYSIHHLAGEPRRTTAWTGVRNFQARNFLRDEIRKGDRVLIYHSKANPPGIVGLATVVKAGYPEPGESSIGRDGDAQWFAVDIKLDQIFEAPLVLAELREVGALRNMELLKKGSRLSVQPVRKNEFDAILKFVGSQHAPKARKKLNAPDSFEISSVAQSTGGTGRASRARYQED